MNIATIPVITTEMPSTIQNPPAVSPNGTPTFIPHKLAINVGIEMIIVMTVNNFITIFTLLEITDAYASIVPERMSR